MDLNEALRVAEKIKPWADRFPEYRAAIDALTAAVRDGRTARPDRGRWFDKSGLDDLFAEMFGMPTEDKPDAPARDPKYPHRTADEKAVDALYAGFTDGWRAARLHYSVDTDATEAEVTAKAHAASRKAYDTAPKVGDEVENYATAIKLPVGTMIDGRNGQRAMVIEHPDELMRLVWTTCDTGGERWPATIAALP